jgi:hypothetical protein
MANPNILNATSIYGNSTYLIPSGTSATVWTALQPAVGTVNRIDYIMAANVTGTAATITVSVNSAGSGGGTPYRIAFQIQVPANTTLILSDKSTAIYLGENQSIVVTSGTSSAIEMTASYEAIT